MGKIKSVLQFIESQTVLWLIAALTLGLAPFSPEPHIWGKLKWVSGGAVGMKSADWFDLFMHGTPWLLLGFALILKLGKKKI